MNIKVCIGKDIHKLRSQPPTIEDLKLAIFKIVPDKSHLIPLIQYSEQSGTTKTISTQEDYLSILNTQQSSIKFFIEFTKDVKIIDLPQNLQPLQKIEVLEVPQDSFYAKSDPTYEKKGFKNSSEPNKNIGRDVQKSCDPREEEKGYDSSTSSEGEGEEKPRHHHYLYHGKGDKDDGYRAFKRMKNKEERLEKKKIREMRKIQLMKEVFTEALFDNMVAIATCVGEYISRPSEDITEKVNKLRPPSRMAEIENMMMSSRIARDLQESQNIDKEPGATNPFYKKLCSNMHEKIQELSQEDRTKANDLLGGIPEKIYSTIEKSNKAKLEKKTERIKKFEQGMQQIQNCQDQSDSNSVKQKDQKDQKENWRRVDPVNNEEKKAYKEEKERQKIEKERLKEEKIKEKEKIKSEKEKEREKKKEKQKQLEKEDDKESEAPIKDQKPKEKKEKPSKPNKDQIENKDPSEKKKSSNKLPSSKPEPSMSIQFIKEGLTSPSHLFPDTKSIMLNITLKNNGETDWPVTSYLYPINPQAGRLAMLNQVQPGKEITTVIYITNPGKSGKHTTEWALAYKNKDAETVSIGNPFSVNIYIEEPPEQPKKPIVEVKKPEERSPAELKNLVNKMMEEFPQESLDTIIAFVKANPGMTIDVLVQKFQTEGGP